MKMGRLCRPGGMIVIYFMDYPDGLIDCQLILFGCHAYFLIVHLWPVFGLSDLDLDYRFIILVNGLEVMIAGSGSGLAISIDGSAECRDLIVCEARANVPSKAACCRKKMSGDEVAGALNGRFAAWMICLTRQLFDYPHSMAGRHRKFDR